MYIYPEGPLFLPHPAVLGFLRPLFRIPDPALGISARLSSLLIMIPAPPTSPSPLPLGEGKEDGENQFSLLQASQASLSSWPIFFDPTRGQHRGYCDQDETQKRHPKCQEDLDRRQLSNDPLPIFNVNGNRCSLSHRTRNGESEEDHEFGCNNMRVNCTTSKMKLMRKMMKSNRKIEKSQAFDDDSNTTTSVTTATARVCSDCNTTKTPLWRSGPHGPKSLCNACGIRRRRERRATAAASDALIPPAASPSIRRWYKQKWQESYHTTQYKKRCKNTAPRSRKKMRCEEFDLSLRKNSALHQVFPQDEKDAAILLMALSCGLVCS